MTDDKRNVHQRLAAAMREVTYIQKEQKKGMQYTIVSHDKVTAKVRPALLAQGIVYYPVSCTHQHNGNRAECAMTVRFVNIDDAQDFFDVPTFGYGIDPQDKGPGKAMSYAVKYALLKAMGLETGDDADHDDLPHVPDAPQSAPDVPPAAIAALRQAATLEALADVWRSNTPWQTHPQFQATKDMRKKELAEADRPAPAAGDPRPPAIDDEIPY